MVTPVIAAILPSIVSEAFASIEKYFSNKGDADKARRELEAAIVGAALASDERQSNINQEEAKHSSIFVSGWRPSIGWILAGALFYQYIFLPIMLWIVLLCGIILPSPPPTLDDNLWQLLTGMLGLSAVRGWEKTKNVARK